MGKVYACFFGLSHNQRYSSRICLCVQRDIDGRTYYEFEFATKANTYIRHALAVVTVANGTILLNDMDCVCLQGANVAEAKSLAHVVTLPCLLVLYFAGHPLLTAPVALCLLQLYSVKLPLAVPHAVWHAVSSKPECCLQANSTH